jgi:hypothetical protein
VRVEIQLHSFLSSTLDEVEWSPSHSNVFAPEVGLDVSEERRIFCFC